MMSTLLSSSAVAHFSDVASVTSAPTDSIMCTSAMLLGRDCM